MMISHLLQILLPLFLLIFGGTGAETFRTCAMYEWYNGHVRFVQTSCTKSKQHLDTASSKQDAVFSDASGAYRVCGSRPQRVLPGHGGQPVRTVGKLSSIAQYHHSKMRQVLRYRSLLLHAPYQRAASCAYYVFALRRILR